MLTRFKIRHKKIQHFPPVDSTAFQELNSTEVGQWIALSSHEALERGLEFVKKHPDFIDSLTDLPEATLVEIFDRLDEEDLIHVLDTASLDDTTYFLEILGHEKSEEILPHLKRPKKIAQYLNYPVDSCGRMMQTEFFPLPIELSVGEALSHIQQKARREDLPVYYLYCLTSSGKLIGVVSLRELAIAKRDMPLEELVNRDVQSVLPTEDIEEAIKIVRREDFVSLPVVDDKKNMLGVILVDDVLDEIEDQATADIYAQAGLQQMDSVTMKARLSYLNRVPWLILNLFLACIASFVISLFEVTIAQITILAVLMPIAATIGGNTAIQTLTIVTRGLATGDFDYISYGKAIFKEILVGASLGLTTGLTAALIIYIWKENYEIGLLLGLSIAINSFFAASIGAGIPIIIKGLGKDPAVGSGVLVTTLTDIFCFTSFLSLATLGLKLGHFI